MSTDSNDFAKKPAVYAILGSDSRSLFCGFVEYFDPVRRIAVVRDCRHVARWYGKTGGITSLAAHGICGPKAGESQIGAPCSATLTGIVNIFECTPEARRTLESAKQQ